MRRWILAGAVSLTFAPLGLGCATRQCVSQQSAGQPAATLGEVVSARPAMPAPDVSALAAYELSRLWPDEVRAGAAYRVLKAQDVQCRAAACCPLANALTAESQGAGDRGKRGKRSADVRSQVLLYRAAQERNLAAFQAVEAFYLLAEAEAAQDCIRNSKQKLDAMLAQLKELEAAGIRVEKAPEELQRQRLAVLDREAQARLAAIQLNSQLRQLLDLPADDATPVWPDVDWKVTVDVIDRDDAVSQGLGHRADVNALRMLVQGLDAGTVEGTRSGLSAIAPMLGAPPAATLVFRHLGSGAEVDARSSQLSELLAAQERVAAEEIHQAASAVETRLQQVSVAKSAVDRRQEEVRLLRLQRQKPGSSATSLDIAAAEVQWFDARRELVRQVLAWRIAGAKLKEAQGLLAVECGVGCQPL